MIFKRERYLSLQALKGLKHYQYKSTGYTLIDDWHQPFWNGITSLLPMWLAPNLITLIGSMFLVVAYVLTCIYLPGFAGEAPRWVYFFLGFSVFTYLHMDCIDGKQARRTKSSSPLGQLFDHGCDALAVHLIIGAVACSLAIGVSWKAVVGTLGIMIPWQLAHWEEYHSGVMLYGNGFWGITEANYLLVLLHWITALYGPGIWRASLSDFVYDKLHLKLPVPVLVNDVLLMCIACFAVSYTFAALIRVLTADKILLPVKERGHKDLSTGAAVGHLLQLGLINLVGAVMMLCSMRNPLLARAAYGTFGIVYALESTKLIMDHMSKEPFSIRHWPIAAMAAVAVNSYFQAIDPPAFAWAVFLVTTFGYLRYVVGNIREICDYLKINCLTLSHLRNPKQTRSAEDPPHASAVAD